MPRWIGTSTSADVVECHFCTQKSRLQTHKGKAVVRDQLPIITGSIYHFLCPYCESWNVKNPSTGDFIDNVQSVHHEVSPAVTAWRNKQASGISETPFCHNCITNQQLQVQLIAGYLPTDTTSNEEKELLSRLPRYKESLDARYPVVCANCQGRIDDIIQERNLKAKARTIGGWLKQSAKLASSTASSAVQMENGELNTPSRLWLWRLKGTCWKVLYICSTLTTLLQPQLALYTNEARPNIDLTLLEGFNKLPWHVLLPVITLFFSFWDPTYRDRVLRSGRVDVKGKKTWFVSTRETTKSVIEAELTFSPRLCNPSVISRD